MPKKKQRRYAFSDNLKNAGGLNSPPPPSGRSSSKTFFLITIFNVDLVRHNLSPLPTHPQSLVFDWGRSRSQAPGSKNASHSYAIHTMLNSTLTYKTKALSERSRQRPVESRLTGVLARAALTDSMERSSRKMSSWSRWRVPVLPRWRANAAAQALWMLLIQFSSSTWQGAYRPWEVSLQRPGGLALVMMNEQHIKCHVWAAVFIHFSWPIYNSAISTKIPMLNSARLL